MEKEIRHDLDKKVEDKFVEVNIRNEEKLERIKEVGYAKINKKAEDRRQKIRCRKNR